MIEDDQLTRELYSRELSRNFVVINCSREAEVVEKVKTLNPQAIVLEPAAFGGKGWEILSEIKAMPEGHSIPIILCSILDERKRGLRSGAIACLVKPVLPMTLSDTLSNVIKSSQKHTTEGKR